jgi:gluconate 5-dehydrogenase
MKNWGTASARRTARCRMDEEDAMTHAGEDAAPRATRHDRFDLSGRVALVTGAYRGLGFAIARGLGNAGAQVVVNGRNADALAGATDILRSEGLAATPALFDVTDRRAVQEGVAAVQKRLGPVDILVNNAGIQRRHALVDFPQREWDEIIATNLTAPYIVAQAVLPAMIERRRGKIIHIASLLSEFARPSVVPYAAAKGGIRQLTRGMAVELARHNVQVNAIAPGYFATEMNRALLDDPAFDAWVRQRTPAGRWGDPDEIAGLAVFLASSSADYITGQMIMIDGGMSVAL